jgi:hypothetical protein
MAINKSERNYWESEIDALINQQEKQMLTDAGHPNFFAEMHEEATQMLIDELGLQSLIEQLESEEQQKETLNKELQELKDRYDQLIHVKNDTIYAIKTELAARIMNRFASSLSYSDRDNWKSKLNSRASDLKNELIAKHPLGQAIAALREKKHAMKRSLMLVNSSKELQDFMRAIYKEFGVKLLED